MQKSSKETMKNWKKLLWWTEYSHNYRNYRLQLKKIVSSSKQYSFLPYLGLYLKDLTFIEDGNKTVLEHSSNTEGDHSNNNSSSSFAASASSSSSSYSESGSNTNNNSTGVVNFQKMRMVANIITEIQIAQRSNFGKEVTTIIISRLYYVDDFDQLFTLNTILILFYSTSWYVTIGCLLISATEWKC